MRSTLEAIKSLGIRAGIALKPNTQLTVLRNELLKIADVVHLMTVEPGLEGQLFIPKSMRRISEMRKMLDKVHPDCDIEVDGNITMENIKGVLTAGDNVIVAGKTIFSGDMTDNIRQMKRQLEG